MHCIGGEWPFVLMRARHGASWRTFQETSFVQLGVATEGFNRAPMENCCLKHAAPRAGKFCRGRCSLG